MKTATALSILSLFVTFPVFSESIYWQRMTSPTTASILSVHQHGMNLSYAAGQSGTLLKYTPQNGWAAQTAATRAPLRSIFFTTATKGWVAGGSETGTDRGLIFKTGDGGLNWTLQQTSANQAFHTVFFPDSSTGFAAGSGGTLIRTKDGGANWEALPSKVSTQLKSLFFVDSLLGFCVGSSGTLLKTSDGGATWSAANAGVTVDLNSVYFKNRDTGYVVGAVGTILKTMDGGSTWIAQVSGTKANLNAVTHDRTPLVTGSSRFFTDAMHIVGDSGTILYCTQSSIKDTWSSVPHYRGRGVHFHSLFFASNSQGLGLVVGDSGVILQNWYESQIRDPRFRQAKPVTRLRDQPRFPWMLVQMEPNSPLNAIGRRLPVGR